MEIVPTFSENLQNQRVFLLYMLTFLLFGSCPIIPLHFCNTYILTLLEPDFTIYLYKVIPISFFVLGVANLGKLYIVPFPMYLKLLLFLFYVFSCLYFIIIFFSDIFFLLKLFAIENPILESIIYKQTKKKKELSATLPVPQVTENQPLLSTPSS